MVTEKEVTPINSASEEEYKTIVVHSAVYKTLLTKKYLNRKPWQKVNEKHELSFIPGTILKLFVKEGEKVKRNQPLLMLEAMKMENTIFALHDCKIAKIHVKVGDRIPKGFLMMEYE
ncbi:MAG: acetyl-CoA carboxylase biotin carboxyl carrier protein subunit [Bacteroidota bacterium]|nr:MAG: acetyl-CoA carboxylase biotin carboxyl carrier protein subunit [Bacteroidota bacterium]